MKYPRYNDIGFVIGLARLLGAGYGSKLESRAWPRRAA